MRSRLVHAFVRTAVVVVVAACGSDPPTGSDDGPLPVVQVATINDLVGPWRAQPLHADPAMADRIADTCSHDMEGPLNVPAQVIDVRGGGVAIVRLAGPTTTIGCDALRITAAGQIEGAGGGFRGDQAEQLPTIGNVELDQIERSTVEGGSLTITGYSVKGRAGPGIASVTIEPEGGQVVTATLTNGWFAGWWPGRIPNDRETMHPAVRIRGFDVTGGLVAETTLQRGR